LLNVDEAVPEGVEEEGGEVEARLKTGKGKAGVTAFLV
jgi:hypothetical protein